MFASGQVLEHFTHGEVNAALRENTLQSIVTGQRAVVFAVRGCANALLSLNEMPGACGLVVMPGRCGHVMLYGHL